MIQPLRRWHRRLIAMVIVTLTIAALLAITHPAPEVRMERLPASLLPASLSPGAIDGGAR